MGTQPLPLGQMAAWIKMPFGMEVGLCTGDTVLDGDPVPPAQKRGLCPLQIFGPCLCGQTAEWIKMVLGTEVGLSPGDCVRWGPSPPR